MQSDTLLNHMKDVAEKLGISVIERVLKKASGIHVRSGLCRVKGEDKFILEKKLSQRDKVELLADCICTLDTTGLFLVPKVRDYLTKHAKKRGIEILEQEQQKDGGNEEGEDPQADT